MQSFLYFLFLTIRCSQVLSEDTHELPPNFEYFPNLESIKAFFRNDTHPFAKQILETFENDCIYMENPGVPEGRRKPFIVIEGNHRSSRDVIGMKLARRLNGRYLTNLAPCLHQHFKHLSSGSTTRRVFYLLSIYASAFNAIINLNLNRAVVMNGYWLEQVTFSLLHSLGDAPAPPISADIFQYPPDLPEPDLLIYLDLPEDQLKKRIPSVQRVRSNDLYNQLSAIHPISIQSLAKVYRIAIDEVYYNVRSNLSDTRDFRHKADPF
ncbi:hypothetical protein J6590_040655 [Homalodisca vitripennis]|nr:hypothetical protein J6590_040655 [Homalodisca vitripennis]